MSVTQLLARYSRARSTRLARCKADSPKSRMRFRDHLKQLVSALQPARAFHARLLELTATFESASELQERFERLAAAFIQASVRLLRAPKQRQRRRAQPDRSPSSAAAAAPALRYHQPKRTMRSIDPRVALGAVLLDGAVAFSALSLRQP